MDQSDIVASLSNYHAETPDYRRGYDQGWEDAYKELGRQDMESTPPLLRRFFWYPTERYHGEKPRWIERKAAGSDEWCNPILSIRLLHGVLHIRIGRIVRGPGSEKCAECARDEKEATDAG